jgi:hypothetical protein
MKGGECPEKLNDFQLIKTDFVPWSWNITEWYKDRDVIPITGIEETSKRDVPISVVALVCWSCESRDWGI